MEIQRIANTLLPLSESQSLAAYFMDNMAKLPGEKYQLFSRKSRTELLDRYRDSNKKLFSSHLSQYDQDYYVA